MIVYHFSCHDNLCCSNDLFRSIILNLSQVHSFSFLTTRLTAMNWMNDCFNLWRVTELEGFNHENLNFDVRI